MADASVDSLLQNLKRLLLYNANLIYDVKDQVQLLYNDFSLFKAFLKDAQEKRSNNAVSQELGKQIMDAVYKAEDIVDMFVTQAAVHNNRTAIKKAFHRFDYSAMLHTVGREIDGITAKVRHIYDSKFFGFGPELLQDEEGSSRPAKWREVPWVEKQNVVGFEDEVENVTKLLIEGPDELEVISIVGMFGLGKTTVAKMIYGDPRIKYGFYNRVWVYVSQEYNRREVFLNIWSQLSQPSGEMYNMTDEYIAKELRAFLERAKYLIVMDDVWTAKAWDDLKIAFPENKRGSRVLLTSSRDEVAWHANGYRGPHRLRFLSPEESLTLLQRRKLGKKELPMELMQHGVHIANKCDGLPLALVVMASILLEKGIESHKWEMVARSIDTSDNMDFGRHMENFVSPSFNDLPSHLRPCFLYFGMFPRDSQIPVWKLIQLWIAEGFILESGELRLESIAEDYLEDLINRNLVMVKERRSNGKVKTCQVHVIFHEFCQMRSSNENFFKEIKEDGRNPHFEIRRRLCIHTQVLNYINSIPHTPSVRSFLCFSKEEIVLQKEHISSIPKAFKLLRVLDAKPITFTRFPADLTQLFHLTYLVLSCNFKIIPAAISRLWNMQSLIIETPSRTLEIKGDIWKMLQLRHLKTNASTSLSDPLAKSRKHKDHSSINLNLQTLSMVQPESCPKDVFAMAPNLRKLGICGRLTELFEVKGRSSLFEDVSTLIYLETLKLLNYPKGKLLKFPERYQFPPRLSKLTLAGTMLDWKHMSTLGMLECLQVLKLKDNAFMGEYWQPEDGGFTVLRVLHIGETDLVSWDASSHHFQRLECLYLKHCRSLKMLPLGLAKVPSLKTLDLFYTTKFAADSARKILQHKQTIEGSEFKLSVYPADHVTNDTSPFLQGRKGNEYC